MRCDGRFALARLSTLQSRLPAEGSAKATVEGAALKGGPIFFARFSWHRTCFVRVECLPTRAALIGGPLFLALPYAQGAALHSIKSFGNMPPGRSRRGCSEPSCSGTYLVKREVIREHGQQRQHNQMPVVYTACGVEDTRRYYSSKGCSKRLAVKKVTHGRGWR